MHADDAKMYVCVSETKCVCVCVRVKLRLFSFQGKVSKKSPGPLHKMTIIYPALMGFLIDNSDSAVVTGEFCILS